jgi:endonuclease/exonuclease/phosphatase (EEP) superfamily protein YafD
VLIILGTLGLFAGVVQLVAYYWRPHSILALAAAASFPYVMIGTLIGAVLFAFARGLYGWIGLGVSAGLLAWAILTLAPLFVAATVPPGRDVVVLTANLRLGTASPAGLVDIVRTHQVDVLMLEELTPLEARELQDAGLDSVLPYGRLEPGYNTSGTGLLSRYPVSDVVVRTGFPFPVITARVAVPGVAVAPTMVALHVFGPYPGAQTATWAQNIARLRPVLAQLPSDAPVVVGGDFNATGSVAQFRALLTGGYADATEQAGAGWTPTYPANKFVPFIEIDHVLTRDAVAHTVDSLQVPGSDHRGLLVTVRLPRAPSGQ